MPFNRSWHRTGGLLFQVRALIRHHQRRRHPSRPSSPVLAAIGVGMQEFTLAVGLLRCFAKRVKSSCSCSRCVVGGRKSSNRLLRPGRRCTNRRQIFTAKFSRILFYGTVVYFRLFLENSALPKLCRQPGVGQTAARAKIILLPSLEQFKRCTGDQLKLIDLCGSTSSLP